MSPQLSDTTHDDIVIVYVDPHELKPHRLQSVMRYSGPSKEFVDNIRKDGITTPLQIDQAYTIISGHNRCQAAKLAGLAEVPVIMLTGLDELQSDLLFLNSNLHREKTTEEKAREFAERKRVYAEIAEQRKVSTQFRPNDEVAKPVAEPAGDVASREPGDESEYEFGDEPEDQKTPRNTVGANLRQPGDVGRDHSADRKNKSATKAANDVGMKARSAEKAAAAIKTADELRAAGDDEAADEIIEVLNTKSVSAAAKLAEQKKAGDEPAAEPVEIVRDCEGHACPDYCRDAFRHQNEVRNVLRLLAQAETQMLALSETPAGILINRQAVGTHIQNAKQLIKFEVPHAVCPYCYGGSHFKRNVCPACKGTGWIRETQWDGSPSDYRAAMAGLKK